MSFKDNLPKEYQELLKLLRAGKTVLIHAVKENHDEDYERFRLVTPNEVEFTYLPNNVFGRSCFAWDVLDDRKSLNPKSIVLAMLNHDTAHGVVIEQMEALD